MESNWKKRTCKFYSTQEACIGSRCLWFDNKTHECFVENPNKQPQRSWKQKTRLERAGKRQQIYNIIHQLHQLNLKKLFVEAQKEEIGQKELTQILDELQSKGLVYSPKPGYIGCVDD
ncbi:MAG: hypothetical protein GF334_01995 [Candidatus Altiarchaeales archaeon]|nr:hypothetical protein [Candidatus Altiarchaeales archaeon]